MLSFKEKIKRKNIAPEVVKPNPTVPAKKPVASLVKPAPIQAPAPVQATAQVEEPIGLTIGRALITIVLMMVTMMCLGGMVFTMSKHIAMSYMENTVQEQVVEQEVYEDTIQENAG